MIAERYSRKSNFVGYSFREDMVSAAMMNLCNNALKFDPAKSSNPFSFYTTAIHNSFLQYMADEKKHRLIRDTLLVDAGANPSFNFTERPEGVTDSDSSGYMPAPDTGEDLAHIVTPSIASEEVVHDKKEPRVRAVSRAHGEVTVYAPGDWIIDDSGKLVLVAKPPEPEPVVKRPRKKAVPTAVKKTPAPKKVVKPKATAKVPKKEVAVAPKKKAEAKPKKEVTTKKAVVAKKAAPKKVAKK